MKRESGLKDQVRHALFSNCRIKSDKFSINRNPRNFQLRYITLIRYFTLFFLALIQQTPNSSFIGREPKTYYSI